jgi:uncharacterized protein (UPF0332 family)
MDDAAIYLAKATESLESAESEFASGRCKSCVNRFYFACFPAAIAGLLAEGVRPSDKWEHEFVHGQFVGILINRRKRYDARLRRVLPANQCLREKAD